jgi:hypothetical protein
VAGGERERGGGTREEVEEIRVEGEGGEGEKGRGRREDEKRGVKGGERGVSGRRGYMVDNARGDE